LYDQATLNMSAGQETNKQNKYTKSKNANPSQF
jgi:hypothetical protein